MGSIPPVKPGQIHGFGNCWRKNGRPTDRPAEALIQYSVATSLLKFLHDLSGKGLGAQEDGETENIKVKVKNDKQGIGATNDYSDTWLDHQDDFNSILAALNTSHSAPGSGTATPTNEVRFGRNLSRGKLSLNVPA